MIEAQKMRASHILGKSVLCCGLALAAFLPLDGAHAGGFAVLHVFTGQSGDGAHPSGGLIADDAGNLYGTTYAGGATQQGTVFKLAPDGTETVLYSFCKLKYCADGAGPVAGLIAD